MNALPPLLQREVMPLAINARTVSAVLELTFDDGRQFALPFELMRVYSPSAEVRGHGEGQEVLQTGQRGVSVSGIEAVGNYGIKPIFSDGHASGIFTWSYLYWLGEHQAELWQHYLARLQAAGYPGETGRDVKASLKKAGACGR